MKLTDRRLAIITEILDSNNRWFGGVIDLHLLLNEAYGWNLTVFNVDYDIRTLRAAGIITNRYDDGSMWSRYAGTYRISRPRLAELFPDYEASLADLKKRTEEGGA